MFELKTVLFMVDALIISSLSHSRSQSLCFFWSRGRQNYSFPAQRKKNEASWGRGWVYLSDKGCSRTKFWATKYILSFDKALSWCNKVQFSTITKRQFVVVNCLTSCLFLLFFHRIAVCPLVSWTSARTISIGKDAGNWSKWYILIIHLC